MLVNSYNGSKAICQRQIALLPLLELNCNLDNSTRKSTILYHDNDTPW